MSRDTSHVTTMNPALHRPAPTLLNTQTRLPKLLTMSLKKQDQTRPKLNTKKKLVR
jgi:hypothetical protein